MGISMRKLFLDKEDMDCSAIIEEEEEKDLTIQTMEEGDVLKNWTTAPSRARRLNPAKCAFEVPAGKFLGFITSRRSIELDPLKIKAIHDFPPPKNKKDVMRFLGRLNYISRYIAKSTVICEPIFKMLRKDIATSWTEECEKAFNKIKEYLSKLPVLSRQNQEDPLLLYLSVLDGAFG
ncbi:uncharacterized mitochondrial protein AtMg00860-like [Nicotiana tomentosiformis]|uniref:uncharacterized mitochondrial protein AtMg00860-like n=1 Tax=Nicotiana tomentosiformis TaxID=4098 RepID=UPI00388CB6A6